MQVVHTVAGVRRRVRAARREGGRIGLVPTMGALHEGHLALVRAAKAETDFVVVSIFVNPTQFGPGEDLAAYPRTLERDRVACEREGVALLFAPSAREMYPAAYATYVVQEGLTERLCGLSRPGHFHGVCTVCAKLFNIVQPDVVFFGQKDFQQTVVIARMIRDLNLDLALRVVPTVREPDGLAMSSRNQYLTAKQRREAVCLWQALRRAEDLVRRGETDASVLRQTMREVIEQASEARVDYVAIVNPDDLTDVASVRERAVAAVAVRFGNARLIDNAILTPPAGKATPQGAA